jgi:hypothetical protein
MSDIALYRQCSVDCLRLADQARSLSERMRLLKLADEWHQMAQRLQRLLDNAEGARREPSWNPTAAQRH